MIPLLEQLLAVCQKTVIAMLTLISLYMPFGGIDNTPIKIPALIHKDYWTDKIDNGNNSYTLKIGQGEINYKNGENFEPINTTLIHTVNGWEMGKSIYSIVIPDYADGWITYTDTFEGKNQQIKIRPICDHILGIQKSDNEILYPKACLGYDLILNNLNAEFHKIIEIASDPGKDLWFDFEIDISGALLKTKTTPIKDFDIVSDKELFVGDNRIPTRILPMYVWDSSTFFKKQPIQVQFYSQNFKTFYRKIITKDFLASATYPVFTDTNLTGRTGVGRGYVDNDGQASWAAARDGTTGTVTGINEVTHLLRWDKLSSTYGVTRIFLPFDLRSMPVGAIVSSSTLTVIGVPGSGDFYTTIISASQTSTSTLDISDFNNVDLTSEGIDSRVNGLGAGSSPFPRFNYVLNATGRGWENSDAGGWFKMGFVSAGDFDNSAPSARGYIFVGNDTWTTSNCTGNDCNIYLYITYTLPPPPPPQPKPEIWWE